MFFLVFGPFCLRKTWQQKYWSCKRFYFYNVCLEYASTEVHDKYLIKTERGKNYFWRKTQKSLFLPYIWYGKAIFLKVGVRNLKGFCLFVISTPILQLTDIQFWYFRHSFKGSWNELYEAKKVLKIGYILNNYRDFWWD